MAKLRSVIIFEVSSNTSVIKLVSADLKSYFSAALVIAKPAFKMLSRYYKRHLLEQSFST
jgi:hypothetical protein